MDDNQKAWNLVQKYQKLVERNLFQLEMKEAWQAIGRENESVPQDTERFLMAIIVQANVEKTFAELHLLNAFVEKTLPVTLFSYNLMNYLVRLMYACMCFYFPDFMSKSPKDPFFADL